MADHSEVQALERQIMELTQQLHALRAASPATEVPDYPLETLQGPTTLRAMFGTQDRLLVIHNMGQACRYCTLWADGINGLLPHLESVMAVVLVSPDPPDAQRRFANSRGWQFRIASHGGGDYIREQTVMEGVENMPGATVYERRGDTIVRRSATPFGPGDQYCVVYPLLGLAGLGAEPGFTPQFRYWTRPATLIDGGDNIAD